MSVQKREKTELFTGSKLLDVADVARVLNVSPSTVRSWVFERRIPYIKFGRSRMSPVKFNPAVLNQWIEENSVEPRTGEEQRGKIKSLPELRRASQKTVQSFNDFVRNLKP